MKRMLSLILVIVLVTLGTTGCAKKNSTDKTIKGSLDVESLLFSDLEVQYIFLEAGLFADLNTPVTAENGAVYFPVESDKYKTTKDLQNLLENTYSDDTVIAGILGTVDLNGKPLYIDIDQKLHKSSEPVALTENMTPDMSTIVTKENGKGTSTFTVVERGGDGAENLVTMTATNLVRGKWLLQQSRNTAAKEPIKSGAGEASSAEIRNIAIEFLDALVDSNIGTIERLTAATEGSYTFLKQSGVVGYEIKETITEENSYGEYTVTLKVGGGNKTFQEGVSDHTLIVNYSPYTENLVVEALRPVNSTAFNYYTTTDSDAANQVINLLRLAGVVKFSNTTQLSEDLITEYALYELSQQQPENYNGFTAEELAIAVKKFFGIENFKPQSTQFLSVETNNYVFLGKGYVPVNVQIYPAFEGNGISQVEVWQFSDPLQLQVSEKILYTLDNNWDGTFTFKNTQII